MQQLPCQFHRQRVLTLGVTLNDFGNRCRNCSPFPACGQALRRKLCEHLIGKGLCGIVDAGSLAQLRDARVRFVEQTLKALIPD